MGARAHGFEFTSNELLDCGQPTQPHCAWVFLPESGSDDATLYRLVVRIGHVVIYLRQVTEGRLYREPQTC